MHFFHYELLDKKNISIAKGFDFDLLETFFTEKKNDPLINLLVTSKI